MEGGSTVSTMVMCMVVSGLMGSDGSRYVGEFKWGEKHGQGQYHFRNGDIYAGEYFADKMHGFGVYQFQNGHQYEGAWHEGRRQGLGMYTFTNGETQCGHWQNGILDDPKRHNSPNGSPCDVDHAKVSNVVQDAHSAAEKTYNMSKVDGGMNKVVAAANKAANAARVAAVKAVQNRMTITIMINDNSHFLNLVMIESFNQCQCVILHHRFAYRTLVDMKKQRKQRIQGGRIINMCK
ncbi:phosphatidylinositol 4-phosphate 5-kinase 1-like [Vigna radiata var. radiata]|uniref:Phosphatidylinositol 4-phosphate 5-kinase 1-like n=1 Tax=Vigna radiata var. radiata TaxID=3916 RepID=A0A3Q0EKI0_VIGRR|nr:phosphatidylinositol 4-phosphate 5-kinase 1-like [Vigna radiata var. radiata]